MKQTGSSSDEPVELYSEYKDRTFNKTLSTVTTLLDNTASSSLRPEDKKVLLVKMMQQIQFDLLTKF